ncbi:hypothetical protein ILYODFUR_031999 [Ilyodon furcidens]|uniref:Secreted protein n=1 Tax=Ilyodon furcidens TaxID=33524 RepID=A0ABV0UKS0_9TELE
MAAAWGLEMIALTTAGGFIIFIACGRADFVLCAFDCDTERGLLLHTPTFSARLEADGLETFLFFFYSALLFQGQRVAMLTVYRLQRSSITVTMHAFDLKSRCERG